MAQTGMNIIPTSPTQGRDPEGVLIPLIPPATSGLSAKEAEAATKKATTRVSLRTGIELCEMGKAKPADDKAAEILANPRAFLSMRSASALVPGAEA